MVKRKYYKRFLEECIQACNGREICIWGARRTGRGLVDTLTEEKMYPLEKIHLADRDLEGSVYLNFPIENPERYLQAGTDLYFICAPEKISTANKMDQMLAGREYADFWFYIERMVKNSAELMAEERDEYANLVATMYSHQNYISDLIVENEYKNVAPITTKIGCPVNCKYCPQDVLIKAYKKRRNPVMELSMETFQKMLGRIPKDVIISFTGFVEPFANPKCLDMILYALENGYVVRVFSTLYNVSVEQYRKFKDYPNLKTLDVHLPDSNGNTVFPITEAYRRTLEYVFRNPPKYARLWTSCLGVTSAVHEKIRDIVSVDGNPINSVHGLVYDNRLFHGRAKLRCDRDCSRIDNPKAGVGMILPNGDVIGCTQDWELENYIGNILEVSSWNELMCGELRKKFRDALDDPRIDNICTYCELAVETDQGDKI